MTIFSRIPFTILIAAISCHTILAVTPNPNTPKTQDDARQQVKTNAKNSKSIITLPLMNHHQFTERRRRERRLAPDENHNLKEDKDDPASEEQSQSQSRRRSSTSGTKRTRTSVSTPIDGVVDKLNEPDPINDKLFQVNPFGVHAHDVLSGRG